MRAKPLILIVDDEENFLEIFSAKLLAAGFETATAKNETEAVQKSKALMPDLILMDIFMPPGPTGTDIALNIHQSLETRGIKIAFLTNLKDPWPAVTGDHKNISKELGMEDFLEKTEDLDISVAKVKEILAKNNQTQPPEAARPEIPQAPPLSDVPPSNQTVEAPPSAVQPLISPPTPDSSQTQSPSVTP